MKTHRISQSRLSNSVALRKDERGLSTVEYVILLVLIAVTGIGIWQKFGKTIYAKIDSANNSVAKDVVSQGQPSN